MKKFKNYVWSILWVWLLAMGIGCVMTAPVKADEAEPKKVNIIATHDLHSHLDSYMVSKDGNQEQVGGFARMKTLIEQKKSENPNTFVFDGGDFSMGTLYQTLFETEAIELVMLGKMGFDATVFGNHEFDYGSQGLANMLHAAIDSHAPLPQLVVCNVDWSKKKGDSGLILEAFTDYGGKDYTVIQKGDVAIAVLGVFGKDALNCVPDCDLTFSDPVESVKKTVEKIQNNEKVDMIVCLSHGGTDKDKSKSEDEILAKEVPELDVIVSGHSHTYLKEPIVQGNTYIVSVSEYGKYVGDISMIQKENGRWEMDAYQNVKLDDSFEENPEVTAWLKEYHTLIEEEYLKQFGFKKNQLLFHNDYTFEPLKDISNKHMEVRLGNYISDAYRYSVERYSTNHDKVDMAIVPSGLIRETLLPGDVTVDKIFEIFSLGKGKDGVVGYPLLGAYLTGAEVKIIAEIDASISDYMTQARLYLSGVHYTFNPNRMILNRVTDIYMTGEHGERIEIDDDKLYYVVADSYSTQMLSAVTDLSKGLLSIKMKNKEGKLVKDAFDCAVDMNGKELKAWYAIAAYTESFEERDGVKVMPAMYAETQGRKVVDNSKAFWDLVKNPNRYTVMIVGVILVIILIIVLIAWLFCRMVKKRGKKAAAEEVSRK